MTEVELPVIDPEDCPVCLESPEFCPGCAGRLLVEVTFESPIAMTLPPVHIGGAS